MTRFYLDNDGRPPLCNATSFADIVTLARQQSEATHGRPVIIGERLADGRRRNVAAVQLGRLLNVYGHTALTVGPDGEDVSGL